MTRLLKSGEMSESSIQISVMAWVKYKNLEFSIISVPNEGKRTPANGRRMKQQGLTKGVSDLLVLLPRHGYGGACIELKAKGGRVSPSQKEFLAKAELNGYFTKIVWGYDDAIHILNWYCFS